MSLEKLNNKNICSQINIVKGLPAGSVAPKTDEKLLSDTNVLDDCWPPVDAAVIFDVPLKPS